MQRQITRIFHNGHVFTADADNRVCQAVAISGNRIEAVGADAEILPLKQDETEVIDCKGKTLLPGIFDSHTHMWQYGILAEGAIVFGVPDIESLREKVAEKISQVEPGAWVQGGSWIETQFAEKRMPQKWDLDPVSQKNPVVIDRIFQICTANSLALQLAGITRDTKDPEGGEILRDEKGEPTGVLVGAAMDLVKGCIPGASRSSGDSQDTEEEVMEYEGHILRAFPEYHAYGVTSVIEPGVNRAIMRAYQSLRRKGQLLMRVNLMPSWHGFAEGQSEERLDLLTEGTGVYTGFGDEWLRLGGLKMAIDWGLTSKTALMTWAYKGEDAPRTAPLRLDLDKLNQWVKTAHDKGFAVGIHVMGDIALEKAVEAIYQAYCKNPVKRAHQIVHAYFPTEDAIKKMKEAGVSVCVQPSYIYAEADGYEDLLPDEKQKDFMPIRTYYTEGITTAINTDGPCASINPFWGLYAAVTRKGVRGYQLGTEQRVDRYQALRMMTIEGAKVTEEEHVKGSIEPGKLADLCLLGQNVTQVSDEELKDLTVDLTVLDGEIVYRSI